MNVLTLPGFHQMIETDRGMSTERFLGEPFEGMSLFAFLSQGLTH